MLSKKLLLTGIIALLCAALAFVAARLMRKQYQASAIVQVGQVGQVGQGSSALPLETATGLADRMKDPIFLEAVLSRARVNDGVPQGLGDMRSFEARPLRDTLNVRLSVQAYSKEAAAAALEAIVAELIKQHNAILEQRAEPLRAQLRELDALIAQTEQMALPRQPAEAAVFAESRRLQLQNLRAQRLPLAYAASPAQTFPTRVLGETYVSPQPVAPNALLWGIGGLVAGAFGALVWLFRRELWSEFAGPAVAEAPGATRL